MYLLDTNVLSELVRREPSPRVVARFEAAPEEDLFTSAICVEEIAFGVNTAPAGNRIWQRFETEILSFLTVLEFNLNTAVTSGALRGDSKRHGRAVGYADTLIAATARAWGLTLVTRNVRHLENVDDLKVENWF